MAFDLPVPPTRHWLTCDPAVPNGGVGGWGGGFERVESEWRHKRRWVGGWGRRETLWPLVITVKCASWCGDAALQQKCQKRPRHEARGLCRAAWWQSRPCAKQDLDRRRIFVHFQKYCVPRCNPHLFPIEAGGRGKLKCSSSSLWKSMLEMVGLPRREGGGYAESPPLSHTKLVPSMSKHAFP